MAAKSTSLSDTTQDMNYTSVEKFEFQGLFEEYSTNGLCFNGVLILPEIFIENIFSNIPLEDILKLTLVCKKWCNIIKSETFWIHKYNCQYSKKAKNLPWYVYYSFFTTNNFTNLIKNGNGQQQFVHWNIAKNRGDKFKVEDPPTKSDPLPSNIPEFYGHTSCFVTSYNECHKYQRISLLNKRLLRYIIKHYRPRIYASEWVAGRFDCGCQYKFGVCGYFQDPDSKQFLEHHGNETIPEDELRLYDYIEPFFFPKKDLEIKQWEGKAWQKLEILIDFYPELLNLLFFDHKGSDTQVWKGHYGIKMAGALLRFEFDSIQPSRVIDIFT